MTLPNPRKIARQKPHKFQWAAWFPYPISWLRALILVPIAFPGSRLIVLGLVGTIILPIRNSPTSLIFCLLFELLISTIILSFPYHLFWFMWQQQSTRYPKWIPRSSSLWEAFYASVVLVIAFISILAIFRYLGFLSCKLSQTTATAVEIAGCTGRLTGRAVKAIISTAEQGLNFDGSGVITKDQDNFSVKPWFAIWLVIAAYLYQIEYLFKQRFLCSMKVVIQKYKLSSMSNRRKF